MNPQDGLAVMREFNDELDVSMCEFYFFYGKALLEVARIEDDVLGNALTGGEHEKLFIRVNI